MVITLVITIILLYILLHYVTHLSVHTTHFINPLNASIPSVLTESFVCLLQTARQRHPVRILRGEDHEIRPKGTAIHGQFQILPGQQKAGQQPTWQRPVRSAPILRYETTGIKMKKENVRKPQQP